MIQLKSVKGTQLYVPKVEINVDTVYLRENIKEKYDEENNRYWEYDETQVDQALAELSILIGEMKNV